jgi:diacylglycerol O-acyltransferase / wax synthase
VGTDAIPLSAEDRAILELECDTIVGHTCKVIVIGEDGPGLEALRDTIAARIEAAPALTRRLGGAPEAPAWEPDPRFDLREHVVAGPPAEPLGERGLRDAVAGLFAQRLDRERPLWRLDVLELRGGASALVWRVHHAVADGTTTMGFARAVLFDPEAPGAGAGAPARHPDPVADDARRRAHLAGFLRREFARSRGRSPFDGRIGTRRRIAFAAAPLRALHDAARRLAGATVNDAVLATVAGGLRRWLELHHGSLGELRAKVPVSLHQEGDDAGNRDSFFAVDLPLNEPDPVARLRAVREETAERKADHDAEEMDALLRELSDVSPRLARFWSTLERSPRRFALNVSNVPGPRRPVSVQGTPVSELHTIAEIGERHALRVSVLSYAGELGFGLCADPAIVHDLDALVAGIEAEAGALAKADPG